MRRASRPCQNPFWKIMLVHRKELRRDANVIYLVIDFLGMGVLPHHATNPSMDLENGCRVCKRHRSFYGRIDGRCLVCRLGWRWSTDNRLRALAKSASSTVNNGFCEGALLHECIKDIVHQHCKDARRKMWRRILTGHFCTQPQADEDSDSSMGYVPRVIPL